MHLSRNQRIGMAAVAVATLPVTALSLQPTNAASTSSAQETFTLVERDGTFRFIDLPPRQQTRNSPPSAGDEFVFTSRLFREGNRVGTLHAVCTMTRRARSMDRIWASCVGTYALPQGRLEVQVGGRLSENLEIAITGGTGRFAGAEGTITTVSRGGRMVDTVRLL